jgi:hypothetical protein
MDKTVGACEGGLVFWHVWVHPTQSVSEAINHIPSFVRKRSELSVFRRLRNGSAGALQIACIPQENRHHKGHDPGSDADSGYRLSLADSPLPMYSGIISPHER